MLLNLPQRWRDDPARAELVDLADDFYLTSAEVARRWRITTEHMSQLRSKRKGPPFVKFGHGGVLYRASIILKYERDGFVQTTPQIIKRKRR